MWLELMICTIIIAALAALSTTIYQGYRNKAWVSSRVIGALASTAKTEMMVYHAVTGDWPKSIDQVRTQSHSLFIDYPSTQDHSMRNVTIEDKRLQLRFQQPFEGNIVTIRPGLPQNDPFGPIVWFAAKPLDENSWHIDALDDTDMPLDLICRQLR